MSFNGLDVRKSLKKRHSTGHKRRRKDMAHYLNAITLWLTLWFVLLMGFQGNNQSMAAAPPSRDAVTGEDPRAPREKLEDSAPAGMILIPGGIVTVGLTADQQQTLGRTLPANPHLLRWLASRE